MPYSYPFFWRIFMNVFHSAVVGSLAIVAGIAVVDYISSAKNRSNDAALEGMISARESLASIARQMNDPERRRKALANVREMDAKIAKMKRDNRGFC